MTILDNLNLCYIWGKTYLPERRRWKGNVDREKKTPQVFYGYESVQGPHQQVFGGLVKLQDLQPRFPNNPKTPNILYLVSSALPYFSVRMAELAKEAGAKLIINQNGVAYPGWYGVGWEKYNRPMQRLHALADYVFYQSKFCKASADIFLGKRSQGYEVLYNPVDTNYFSPGANNGSGGKEFVLLLAGSHWSPYRPLIALDVLQHLRAKGVAAVLRIAGRFCWGKQSGEAQRQVMAYALDLGVEDNVELTGPYSQQEALTLFQGSSLLLHTKYNDPCPRLVVEAMACGLPVVYSATGGTPELVGKEAGVGVPGKTDWENDHPPDAEQLACAVEQVIADLKGYSKAARSRAVEKFDVQPWLDRHEDIFNHAVD